MSDSMDWEAVRTLLAVAEAGSLSSGAARLGLSQPTASRHVQRLEASLGGPLLIRHGRGVRPTSRGLRFLAAAQDVAAAMQRLERAVTGSREEAVGAVRVSAPDAVGIGVLVPALGWLRERWPRITVELVLDNRPSDLLAGEADVAVRMFAPTQLDLVARKVGVVRLGLFGSLGYLARRGVPATLEELAGGHELIGYDPRGPLADAQRTLVPGLGGDAFVLRTDSPWAHVEAARAGLGLAVLHTPTAAAQPDLVEVLPGVWPLTAEVWLAVHQAVRGAAHVQAVVSWLDEVLRGWCAASPGGADDR